MLPPLKACMQISFEDEIGSMRGIAIKQRRKRNMNIYDTANRLAGEIRSSEECVRLRELRERVYADDTNRVLLEEYKRLQVKLQMSMVGAAGQMPGEDMQRFQQLASLLYMNSDVQAYLMAEMQMQKTLADVFKILTEAAGVSFDLPENA